MTKQQPTDDDAINPLTTRAGAALSLAIRGIITAATRKSEPLTAENVVDIVMGTMAGTLFQRTGDFPRILTTMERALPRIRTAHAQINGAEQSAAMSGESKGEA